MSMETSFRLSNGLRVFVQESHTAPVVAVQVWINVGSADERPDEAGIAHLLEHMMFKGTARRGMGEVAREVEASGGEVNAYTSFDQTVYHITIASRHWDLALDILSDVVQDSQIDAAELALEKEVVLEEVRRYLDNPGRQLSQGMFRTVFQHHPYGRPVIGYEETVRGFQREHVLSFYHRWYTPDNMALVVVGDVDTAAVKKLVTKLFKNFARPAAPARVRAHEPAQETPRSIGLHMPVQEAQLDLAFPVPQADHPDTPLLDLLALILGQGESSRLVEHVRNQKQLVNSVHAYAYTPHDPGMFVVGTSFEVSRLEQVYEALLEELHGLRHAPPRGSELRKAQSILLSDRVFEKETVDGRARKFGYYMLSRGGFEQEKAYFRRIEEATVEELWRVARAWLAPEKLTLGVMMPKGKALPDLSRLLERGRAALTEVSQAPVAKLNARREAQTVRIELPNGLRLLVRQNHTVPVVAMRAVFEGGLRFENTRDNGSFQMMSTMLTRGTAQRRAFQIAHEVESLAASMGGFSGRSSFGLRAELLSQHLERGFELFSEILRAPSFEPQELDKMRRIMLEAVRNQADHPGSYVFRVFSQQLFKQHPFRFSTLGTEESLQKMTSASLKKTWERYARASNGVLAVVGDVDPVDMERLVLRQLGEFRSGVPVFPQIPAEAPLKKRRVAHEHSDKNQLHMVIGWRGVSLDHPDRYALQVLSSVLSGQGGRLFVELRDKQALAYSVSSMSVEALGEGFFALYIGSDPSKEEKARTGLLLEIDKVLQDGITAEELARAQRFLVGSYEIDLQRGSNLASNLAFNELYGLGCDDYQHYPERIQGVSTDEVLRVARRLLDPRAYVMATVGPQRVEAGPVST